MLQIAGKFYTLLCSAVTTYTYIHSIYQDSKLFSLVHFIPSWLVQPEIELHVALPKWPINQFKFIIFQQSRQQMLRVYCPKIYTYCAYIHTKYIQRKAAVMQTRQKYYASRFSAQSQLLEPVCCKKRQKIELLNITNSDI